MNTYIVLWYRAFRSQVRPNKNKGVSSNGSENIVLTSCAY